MSRKTIFPFTLWRWTAAEENLFHLRRPELEIFKQLVREAAK